MAGNALAYVGRDVNAALLRAQCLSLLRLTGNEKYALDNQMRADGWTIALSAFLPSSASNRACYWCFTTNQYLFVFVDGIRTPAEGQSLWDGYTGPYVNLGTLPSWNQWANLQCASMITEAFSGCPTPTDCFVSCYSAGGPVSLFFPGLMTGQWRPLPRMELIAFGSPKPGQGPQLRTAGYGRYSHWANVDDAVPLIPPRVQQYQRVMAGLSYSQGQAIALYRQFEGGIIINLDSTTTPADESPANPVPATEQIGNWILQQEAGLQTPHSLPVYIARLQSIVAASQGHTAIRTAASNIGPPSHTSAREIRQAIASTVQTVFTDASRQNATPVSIPTQRLFTVTKRGKVYYVTFGGVDVAIAPFRRRAHGLARAGNDWLRRLQNEAVVSADDLNSQFALYLAAASDPSSNIKPTMNTRVGG